MTAAEFHAARERLARFGGLFSFRDTIFLALSRNLGYTALVSWQ